MQSRFILLLLLLAVFWKGVAWASLVPVWQFPDEQAHFAQIAFLAESNRLTVSSGPNVNREIYLSEKFLGTLRDWRGNNQFTFHPEYRGPQPSSLTGQYEAEIRHLSIGDRKEMMIKEATAYPPLYYTFSLYFYRAFYQASLFERVYAVRIFSIFLQVLTIITAYKMFFLVFRAKPVLALSATALVAFHPMFTFVESGVNSDVMFNLLFTASLYLAVRTLRFGLELSSFVLIICLVYMAILTKPQGYILIFIFLLPLALQFFQSQIKTKIMIGICALLLFFFLQGQIYNFLSGYQFMPDIPPFSTKPLREISFTRHIMDTIRHTWVEVLPWYWGVFRWLSLALPRQVNRIINRVLIVTLVGMFIHLATLLRRRKIKEFFVFFFLVYASLLYFGIITFYDYLFTRANGFSFGVQGRYFFPTICAHMALILIGLVAFFPKENWRDLVAKLASLGMIILNFVALFSLSSSYYDVGSWQFFFQASQYKPYLMKFPWLIVWLVLYLLSVSLLTINFFRFRKSQVFK